MIFDGDEIWSGREVWAGLIERLMLIGLDRTKQWKPIYSRQFIWRKRGAVNIVKESFTIDEKFKLHRSALKIANDKERQTVYAFAPENRSF